ncbi:MAG: hypothetical protein MJK18_10500 [Bdellovibrionales bacterium]|nr:hypothetical protein [Bdellovibrionales bacterium]
MKTLFRAILLFILCNSSISFAQNMDEVDNLANSGNLEGALKILAEHKIEDLSIHYMVDYADNYSRILNAYKAVYPHKTKSPVLREANLMAEKSITFKCFNHDDEESDLVVSSSWLEDSKIGLEFHSTNPILTFPNQISIEKTPVRYIYQGPYFRAGIPMVNGSWLKGTGVHEFDEPTAIPAFTSDDDQDRKYLSRSITVTVRSGFSDRLILRISQKAIYPKLEEAFWFWKEDEIVERQYSPREPIFCISGEIEPF